MRGWQELRCNYFGDVCIEAVGAYLARNGFKHVSTSDMGAVTFTRDDVFLELSYDAHSYPAYRPRVALGFGSGKYGVDGKLMAVPLWFVTGKLGSFDYSAWEFASESQLRQVLVRIEVEVLNPYAKALWGAPALLEELLLEFRSRGAI